MNGFLGQFLGVIIDTVGPLFMLSAKVYWDSLLPGADIWRMKGVDFCPAYFPHFQIESSEYWAALLSFLFTDGIPRGKVQSEATIINHKTLKKKHCFGSPDYRLIDQIWVEMLFSLFPIYQTKPGIVIVLPSDYRSFMVLFIGESHDSQIKFIWTQWSSKKY